MSYNATTFTEELAAIEEAGLTKRERIIGSPQDRMIRLADGREVLNFCANNYLGLANHPKLIEAAKQALDEWGFGLASVRFICGTQELHTRLEKRLAEFLGMDDVILYSSCFDANGGLFETLLGPDDAIISDALNHASIIDGTRLCKARRLRYANCDMAELESCLQQVQDCRRIMIATDGVFSMDGAIAPLSAICDLADRYNAMVMVDDSHAVGFIGEEGRGTPELHGVIDRIDIVTGTLGKALGGASGGYTAAHQEIVDLLRQRSRPYLFSNTLAPVMAGAAIAALDLLSASGELRERLRRHANRFRSAMTEAGFDIVPGEHPIVPVMLGDARLASAMADDLLERGIYVIGFSYPVVPESKARIRVQLSAVHTDEDIEHVISAFIASREAMSSE